jgi:DNA-directed RNA polymerase I, II, and III subunit RPABC2
MSDDEGYNYDIEEEVEEYSEIEDFDEEEEAVIEYDNNEEKNEEEFVEKEEEIIIDLESDEIIEEKDSKKDKKMQKIEKDKRVTLPYLTKFEKARVIGTRAVQISMGAKTNVQFSKFDPIEIATKELHTKNLPLIIRRHLPNNKYEDWSVSELMIL